MSTNSNFTPQFLWTNASTTHEIVSVLGEEVERSNDDANRLETSKENETPSESSHSVGTSEDAGQISTATPGATPTVTAAATPIVSPGVTPGASKTNLSKE